MKRNYEVVSFHIMDSLKQQRCQGPACCRGSEAGERAEEG